MYDSFDNMYQATIGIDFLSKVSTSPRGSPQLPSRTLLGLAEEAGPAAFKVVFAELTGLL